MRATLAMVIVLFQHYSYILGQHKETTPTSIVLSISTVLMVSTLRQDVQNTFQLYFMCDVYTFVYLYMVYSKAVYLH